MAPQVGGTDKSAKEVLDEFGQKVHEQVKKEAQTYKGELEGNLSFATFSGVERAFTKNPCTFKYDELINGSGGAARGNPCGSASASDKRFSKERVDEYDEKKIRDSNKSKGGNNEGECAPYRRLSLCNKNFQKINNDDSTNAKNDLLLDVCYAAKFEGESIKAHLEQYDATYPGSGHTTCTALARSFADIGDIVRGRDLFIGYNQKEKKRRKQLDDKLKDIFGDIYKELTSGRNGKKEEIERRYGSDKNNNYYQLREDWWTANRETVWKAITCAAKVGDTYFRATCDSADGKSQYQTQNQCRCTKSSGAKADDQVPTYFDYVPQYLRWFEEWAEDFCRKKKKKVEKLEKSCRGEYQGEKRYCSRNGYDCEKTKRAIGKYRMGNQCISCLYGCNPYVEWIENQRKQFDKQKKKYTDEMEKYENGAPVSGRQRRSAHGGSNVNGYEKKFYEKFKGKCGTVDAFLKLLNKEKECNAITDTEGGRINFEKVNSGGAVGGASGDGGDSGTNVESQGTFYRSKYCQPCPHCGVKKKRNGDSGNQWEEKSDSDQCNIKLYKPKPGESGTPIEILKSGEGHDDIETKLNAFCNQTSGSSGGGRGDCGGTNIDSSLCEPWQCYQFDQLEKDKEGEEDEDDLQYDNDVKNAGGLCILKNTNKKEKEKEKKSEEEPKEIQKTFYDFFYYWVAHMLKDSIHWRTKKIKGCLENGKKKCGNQQCKVDCDCFKRWVKQKENEWKLILEHFKTQPGFDILGNDYDYVLKEILKKDELLSSIKSGYGNAKELEGIKNMLNEENEKNQVEAADGNDSKKKNTIDKLLQHEGDDANNCLKKHKDNDCPKPKAPETPGPDTKEASPHNSEEDVDASSGDEEEDEEEEEEEAKAEAEAEGSGKDATEEVGPKEEGPQVNVCSIVEEALKGNLDAACSQKYSGIQSRLGWKCIPSGDSTATSGGVPGDTTGGKDGATCIPPRRRRLYVGKLHNWANKHNTEASQKDGTQALSGQATENG
ncbi:hypothetical protein PFFCH_05469, partial [Plasmodium falciparum FCH/4]